jgi:hypothetical protein
LALAALVQELALLFPFLFFLGQMLTFSLMPMSDSVGIGFWGVGITLFLFFSSFYWCGVAGSVWVWGFVLLWFLERFLGCFLVV